MTLSSRQKIALLLTTTVSSFLIVVLGTIILVNHYRWYTDRKLELYHESSEFIKEGIKEDDDDEKEINHNSKNYYYKNINGIEYAKGVFKNKDFFDLIILDKSNEIIKINYSKDNNSKTFIVIKIKNGKYTIYYAQEITTYIEAEKSLILSSLIVLLCAVLLSFFIGLIISKIILKPIQKIVAKTKLATLENMPKDLLIHGKKDDEIVQLSETLNLLFNKIQSSANQIKQFNHDVSHELKTPLAIIKSDIELALKTEDLNRLHDTVNDIDHLSEMIEKLLFLAHKSEDIEIQEIDSTKIKNIFDSAINKCEIVNKEKKLNHKITIENGFSVRANESLIKDLIFNLIENAFKYNIPNGEIHVTCDKEKIIIANSSNRIEQSDLSNLFEVFYRVDNVRSKEGYGIGLSIVKKICNLFKWKISAKFENNLMIFEIQT